ncbi:hypothetical protein ACFPYI_08055 [Halomarina salina]|uniref:Uncharacterized protein n=1 Tax=Halomarina salina TaxID=1872699 RepID=A0ABD5RLP5_9EURY|nr:hypothetical protein [Halomarina salina]
MSESDDPSGLTGTLRTVTPEYFGRPDAEMDVFGWSMFLGLVILLVPLLPFIVIVWLISKLAERGHRRAQNR